MSHATRRETRQRYGCRARTWIIVSRHHLPLTTARLGRWQSGDGALTSVALHRAFADRPPYSMAVLMRQALDSGASLPPVGHLPTTPEEVTAAYDAAEAEEACRHSLGAA